MMVPLEQTESLLTKRKAENEAIKKQSKATNVRKDKNFRDFAGIQDRILGAFRSKPYWNMKDLAASIQQPMVSLFTLFSSQCRIL